MNRRHLLLVVAAWFFIAAGTRVHEALGMAVAGLCALGAWYLLAPEDES